MAAPHSGFVKQQAPSLPLLLRLGDGGCSRKLLLIGPMSTTLKVRSFPTKFLLIVSTARQHRWVFSVQLGSLPQSFNPQQRPSGNCYHWGWTHGISSSSSMQKLCWEGQQWWCLHLLCAKHPTYLILGPCKRGITISICQVSKLRLSQFM